MRKLFIEVHKKRDALVFWVCILGAVVVFFANDVRAVECDKATIINQVEVTTAAIFQKLVITKKDFSWTDKECEILWAVAEKLAIKEIAKRLDCKLDSDPVKAYSSSNL